MLLLLLSFSELQTELKKKVRYLWMEGRDGVTDQWWLNDTLLTKVMSLRTTFHPEFGTESYPVLIIYVSPPGSTGHMRLLLRCGRTLVIAFPRALEICK